MSRQNILGLFLNLCKRQIKIPKNQNQCTVRVGNFQDNYTVSTNQQRRNIHSRKHNLSTTNHTKLLSQNTNKLKEEDVSGQYTHFGYERVKEGDKVNRGTIFLLFY